MCNLCASSKAPRVSSRVAAKTSVCVAQAALDRRPVGHRRDGLNPEQEY